MWLGHALAEQGIGDVLSHIHMWIEREHLEHESDISLARRFLSNFFTIDIDFAAGWKFKPGHHAQRRRLATARWAKQHEKFAIFNGEGGRLDGIEIAKILAHIFDLNLCHILFRKMADDDEHHRANQCDEEGVAV